MADEETGTTKRTTGASGEEIDSSPTPRHEREQPSLGVFSLPPISLPDVRLPERIHLLLPIPEPATKYTPSVRLRTSWVLAIVVLLDLLDAVVGLIAGFDTLPWLRSVVGLGVSILFAGPAGLLYAWELIATVAGFGWLALAPTATLLVLGRLALRR
ncbi:hypothetical protein [Halorussus halophilus]|uniref:hypothetical protein n=1 Tax=Halorussus halophilus TaxID=2650975 RepID=UPI0013011522|nr:hypothetical protein [Halorussus halophilus]